MTAFTTNIASTATPSRPRRMPTLLEMMAAFREYRAFRAVEAHRLADLGVDISAQRNASYSEFLRAVMQRG